MERVSGHTRERGKAVGGTGSTHSTGTRDTPHCQLVRIFKNSKNPNFENRMFPDFVENLEDPPAPILLFFSLRTKCKRQ